MGDKMLRVENLKKYFPVQKSALEVLLSRRRDFIRAVDGVREERSFPSLVRAGVEKPQQEG